MARGRVLLLAALGGTVPFLWPTNAGAVGAHHENRDSPRDQPPAGVRSQSRATDKRRQRARAASRGFQNPSAAAREGPVGQRPGNGRAAGPGGCGHEADRTPPVLKQGGLEGPQPLTHALDQRRLAAEISSEQHRHRDSGGNSRGRRSLGQLAASLRHTLPCRANSSGRAAMRSRAEGREWRAAGGRIAVLVHKFLIFRSRMVAPANALKK